MTLDEIEKAMIVKCMRHYEGNVTRVAEALGLSRAALYRRFEKYGLDPAEREPAGQDHRLPGPDPRGPRGDLVPRPAARTGSGCWRSRGCSSSSIVFGVLLVRTFFVPLELIRTGAELIGERDFTSQFREVGQPEMDALIRIYNQMIDRLREERLQLQEQHLLPGEDPRRLAGRRR